MHFLPNANFSVEKVLGPSLSFWVILTVFERLLNLPIFLSVHSPQCWLSVRLVSRLWWSQDDMGPHPVISAPQCPQCPLLSKRFDIGRPTASFKCPWNTQNNLSTNQKWVSIAGKHKLTIYGHNTTDIFSDATSYTNTCFNCQFIKNLSFLFLL